MSAAKERIDDLQRNGCRIIQRPDLFCFGMDAVLLAAWAEARRGDRILDLCSGNGIVPILMDARLPEEIREEGSVHFTGVEINSTCVDMARRSALMNGQSERMHFLQGDVRGICGGKLSGALSGDSPDEGLRGICGGKQSGALSGDSPGEDLRGREARGPDPEPAPDSFDCVTVNPPYMTGGGGLTGGNVQKTIARHEVLCTVDDVAAAAARAMKRGGHVYMVHRPHRLGDIFRAFDSRKLAVKRIRMVHPFADREANLVLIDAVKGGKSYVHAEKPLVIYREAGVYTEELRALYG